MSISGIETKYQNNAISRDSSAKSNDSDSAYESFQNELVNWEKRIKDNIDKEQANDNSGNIQMSDKHWRSLMKKVDSAIDTFKSTVKEQEKEENEQAEVKKSTSKDTVNISI